ncbi:hypothetical protein AAZX31_08G057200 [Glycine max]|uniref:LysM domain-containing protein n=2 Tax=Glycine subgen. Soja TaxID=1462606 RepID=K7L566_SOYBN|nr:hypothetical protein JHK87_020473 [Glycine soja]KAG5014890.1 hypothetical protein JHK85_021026 [Glycine max]KAG5024670.1 hypothetical protein JHK86_020584 [Glycine max]KAG5135839.1 hypothetical protein JHK82_020570 [Glycine max]KAH1049836.1 hypothetical protein GYH30_020375 [Glycine max]
MMKFSSISFALILSFLLITMFIAESRPTPTVADPVCSIIHGVEEGETCFTITQRFILQERQFLEINPNINCNTIFVGQWVCVNGKVN